MKKFAIALIGVALLVVLGANLFLARLTPTEPDDPVSRDNTTLRSTNTGEVVGFIGDYGARTWLGIPFALAPTGDLRWRAPQPMTAWSGVREALRIGSMCPQFPSQLAGTADSDADGDTGTSQRQIVGNEDCLYLNVWAPPNAQNLPVMLWVHGGSNTMGQGGIYNGARLAVQERVVVISINYRLGLLGWFNHAALDNGNPRDSSGNYGTLDLLQAMQWTQANVRNFGGNPSNVTLFGESAGGYDILAMIASPLAKGLFHRTIVQSGGLNLVSQAQARNMASAGGHPNSSAEVIAALMVADNTAANLGAARQRQNDMPTLALKDYLYKKSADELYAIFDAQGLASVDLPANFADGYVLPKRTNEEIFGVAANHNLVPTLLGTNRDEPSLFMVQDPRWVTQWLGLLPRLRDEHAYRRAVKYGALAWKERGVDSIASLMRAAGNPNVYAYQFDWDELPSIMGYDLSVALGAGHGMEIAFVFGDFDGALGTGYLYEDSPDKEMLAMSMMGYWAEFARSGNPGKGNGQDPRWLAWDTDNYTAMVLDTPPLGIRMTQERVTLSGLKTLLANDADITSDEERCRFYANLFRGSKFDEDEFASFGPNGCANYSASELRDW